MISGKRILEHGKLRHESGALVPFHMRLLKQPDMDQMTTLRDEIEASMTEWDLLLPTPDYVLEKGLDDSGMSCGVFTGDRLVGLRSVYFPRRLDTDHIGKQADIAANELDSVAELKLSLVAPEYRGNGLQKRMTAHLFDQIKQRGMLFKYYMAIVSPKNVPSMSEKFSFRMKISKIIIKNNNYVRFLFTKNMVEHGTVPLQSTVYAKNRDFEFQSDLLQNGYNGYEMRRGQANMCDILYAK